MKKYLFLFLLLLFPMKTFALSIHDVNVKAPDDIKEGESFIVEISSILFNYDYKEGIISAAVEFEYDENIFNLTSVYTDDYDSVIVKQDGKHYIVSVVNDSTAHKCSDGTLNCHPYTASLAFYVKDTDKFATNIKINELELDVFDVYNDYDEYDLNDAEAVNISVQKTHAFNIIQANHVNSAPSSIVTNDASVVEGSKEEIKEEAKKSTKPYLKSLSIKGYSLDFKSDQYSYRLVVPNDVNSLDVVAKPLLDDSNVEVLGADDLEKSSNRVKINVTLKDGTKSVYYIQVKKEGLSQKTYQSSFDKLNKIAFIVGGVVLFIIIISTIVSILNKRKMKKLGY